MADRIGAAWPIALLTLLASLLTAFPLSAQPTAGNRSTVRPAIDDDGPLRRRVRHLTPAEGLPNPQTWRVDQDRDDAIWIASSSGLSRYDGNRFTTYTISDGLPNNRVIALAADIDGGIWAGTSQGLARVRQERVTTVLDTDDGLASEVIRDLTMVSGQLWIGTEAGVHRLDAGRPMLLPTADGSPEPQVRRLVHRQDGAGVWVTTDSGLWFTEDDVLKPVELPSRLRNARILSVAEVRDNLWVGTENGLWRRQGDANDWTRYDTGDGLTANHVSALASSGNHLWIGTWGSGMSHWSGERFSSAAYGPRMPIAFVTDLRFDREGTLWASGHKNGVALLVRSDFQIFNEANNAPSLVQHVAEDRSGRVWLGSGVDGLAIIEQGRLRQPDPRVWGVPREGTFAITRDLQLDIDRRAWIATGQGVLLADDPLPRWFSSQLIGGAPQKILTDDARCLAITDRTIAWLSDTGVDDQIEALTTDQLAVLRPPDGTAVEAVIDSQQVVWIGSESGLLRWKSGGPLQHFGLGDGLPSEAVRALLATPDGLWVGTRAGLARIRDREVVETFTASNGLTHDGVIRARINLLMAASNGDIWLGTEKGPMVYRKGQFQVPATPSGFIGSRITVLAEDRAIGEGVSISNDSVWVGTDLGLNRCHAERGCEPFSQQLAFEQQTFHQVLRADNQTVWFITSMGVHRYNDRGGNPIFYPCRGDMGARSIVSYSAMLDSQRGLWVGTDTGAVRFNAQASQSVQMPLAIELREMRFNGQMRTLNEIGNATLPPDTTTLAVEYTALTFRDPEHVTYTLQITGEDGIVTYQTGDRRMTVGMLRPGDYHVSLGARDTSGGRSENAVEFAFQIMTPLWQRPWVQVLASVVLMGLVWLVVQWRTNSLRKQSDVLEKLVKERTSELDAANAKLARLATQDELTGLPNSRYFWKRARELRAEAKRGSAGFGLIIIDLDKFKSVNDNYGHPVGDSVLRHAAKTLSSSMRAENVVTRYGGEEFAALLRDSDLPTTAQVAERMRATLASTPCVVDNDLTIRVTGSFGVGAWGGAGDSLRELFRRTDDAVYNAKEAGRNTVRISVLGEDSRPPLADTAVFLPEDEDYEPEPEETHAAAENGDDFGSSAGFHSMDGYGDDTFQPDASHDGSEAYQGPYGSDAYGLAGYADTAPDPGSGAYPTPADDDGVDAADPEPDEGDPYASQASEPLPFNDYDSARVPITPPEPEPAAPAEAEAEAASDEDVYVIDMTSEGYDDVYESTGTFSAATEAAEEIEANAPPPAPVNGDEPETPLSDDDTFVVMHARPEDYAVPPPPPPPPPLPPRRRDD
ncbi:MAG: diguanylate cyclase [Acidobacteriota bacterium]